MLIGNQADFLDAGKGAVIRGDSVYMLVNGPSWAEAESNANALGGNLVTINDPDENQFLVDTFLPLESGRDTLWTGLNDANEEGVFVWSSGDPSEYRNWRPGDPNNGFGNEDYGQIDSNGGWLDNSAFSGNNRVFDGIAEIPLSNFIGPQTSVEADFYDFRQTGSQKEGFFWRGFGSLDGPASGDAVFRIRDNEGDEIDSLTGGPHTVLIHEMGASAVDLLINGGESDYLQTQEFDVQAGRQGFLLIDGDELRDFVASSDFNKYEATLLNSDGEVAFERRLGKLNKTLGIADVNRLESIPELAPDPLSI